MRLIWSSDQSLLVRDIDDALRLFYALQKIGLARGVTGLSPARSSLLIRFDARVVTHEQIEAWVAAAPVGNVKHEGALVEIPAKYDGPDLPELAAARGLSLDEVIALHSATPYTAYFLGFVPGFAYLGDVPDAIAAPRRTSPRLSVPAGSIGIAGKQTGVYPVTSPGGWNLIATTEAVMFDRAKGKSLIQPGDRVRFRPV